MLVKLFEWPCKPCQVHVPLTQCPPVDNSEGTGESAFDDFLYLLIMRDRGNVSPLSVDTCCQSAPSPVTARTPPCTETGKHKLAGQHLVCSSPSKRVCTRPISRVISNDTYLRRLHLSPKQMVALVPCLRLILMPFATKPDLRARVDLKRVRRQINVVTEAGRSWHVVCECTLYANKKQLHCRLGPGWAQFCRDNCVTVNDTVVMERGCCRSEVVLVKIKRENVCDADIKNNHRG